MSKTVSLYGGAIQAHKSGSFVKGGEAFQVISPGYCIQGRRRIDWTQIVHEDIPVFTVKMRCSVAKALKQFDMHWDKAIGKDRDLMQAALAACKKEHRRKFRAEDAGNAPAPTSARDGRRTGLRSPA